MGLWGHSIIMATFAVALCLVSRKFYWLVVPFCLFNLLKNWIFLGSDETVRDGLVTHFGLNYFLQFAASEALPLVVVLVLGSLVCRRPTHSA